MTSLYIPDFTITVSPPDIRLMQSLIVLQSPPPFCDTVSVFASAEATRVKKNARERHPRSRDRKYVLFIKKFTTIHFFSAKW